MYPSAAPTFGCADSPLKFLGRQFSANWPYTIDCKWIAYQQPWIKRHTCKEIPGISELCPATCGARCTCKDTDIVVKLEMPTGKQKSGTCKDLATEWRCINVRGLAETCRGTCGHGLCDGSPSASPTSSPTNNCSDSPFRFRVKHQGKMRYVSCQWISNDSEKRCEAKAGALEICASTCGACVVCKDTATTFKIERPNGTIIRTTCGEWATKWRCENIKGLAETCRESCGLCN